MANAEQPQKEEEVCSICLEPLTKENQVFLPCDHGFHTNCINDWTNSRQNQQQQQHGGNMAPCPLCRKEVGKDVIQELARPMDWVDIVLTPFIVVIWSGQMVIKAPKRIYNLLLIIAKKSITLLKATFTKLAAALKSCGQWIKDRSGRTVRALGRAVLFTLRKLINAATAVGRFIKPYLGAVGRVLGRVLTHLWRATKAVVVFIDRCVTAVLTKLVQALVTVLKWSARLVSRVARVAYKVVKWVLTKTAEVTVKALKWLGHYLLVVPLKALGSFIKKTLIFVLKQVGRLLQFTWKALKYLSVKAWTAAKIIYKYGTLALKNIIYYGLWKPLQFTYKAVRKVIGVVTDYMAIAMEFLMRMTVKFVTFAAKIIRDGILLPFKNYILMPLFKVIKFMDRMITAGLEWTLRLLWKTLLKIGDKMIDLMMNIVLYGAKALKFIDKIVTVVLEWTLRALAKGLHLIWKSILTIGDKLFDLVVNLIAYTAVAMKFLAFKVIKPTAVWLWTTVKTIARLSRKFLGSLGNLLMTVAITFDRVLRLVVGKAWNVISHVLRVFGTMFMKIHGVVVLVFGIVAKFLLEMVFKVLYGISVTVAELVDLLLVPVRWMLLALEQVMRLGLTVGWKLIVLTAKLLNFAVWKPAKKIGWFFVQTLTLAVALWREFLVVSGTMLMNAIGWTIDAVFAVLKLTLKAAVASVKWTGRTLVDMVQRFILLIRMTATFLLKVKRQIGAILIAIKDAGIRIKNKIVGIAVATWTRIVLAWNYLGSRLKAAYNHSPIPRILSAIKTASVFLAVRSKEQFIAVKNRLAAIIHQIRENGKLRRARMMAFVKARILQMKLRAGQVAALVRAISARMTQRLKTTVARISLAATFMTQRAVALKDRAVAVQASARARIALLALRMKQQVMQVNQFVAYMQARLAALFKQRMGGNNGNVNNNKPARANVMPMNNDNTVAQPVQ